MPKTVKQAWDEYADSCFMGLNISNNSLQYIETKQAFYSGYLSLMKWQLDTMTSKVSEKQGADYMDAIFDEVQNELKKIIKDKDGK